MTAKQRLAAATSPLPLLTPQAPGQLSLTGEPVPGEGGTMYTVTTRFVGARLQRIPIRHACGHFELRLTRWGRFNPSVEVETPDPRGYLDAGSNCSKCDNGRGGRSVQENYETVEAAQRASEALGPFR